MADIEIKIGKIMRYGVILAMVIMAVGLALLFINGNGGYPNNAFPTSFKTISHGCLHAKPYAIMMAGMFILILTPVLRVVVSIYAFMKERDYLYVAITIIVFVILISSLLIGEFH